MGRNSFAQSTRQPAISKPRQLPPQPEKVEATVSPAVPRARATSAMLGIRKGGLVVMSCRLSVTSASVNPGAVRPSCVKSPSRRLAAIACIMGGHRVAEPGVALGVGALEDEVCREAADDAQLVEAEATRLMR